MKINKVWLRKGREKSVKNRHPWIFSGAISRVEEEDTPVTKVLDWNGNFLGWGLYNPFSSLAIRLYSFEEEKPINLQLLEGKFEKAIAKRSQVKTVTNGYRVINSEGDDFSGLVVDYYNGFVVFQIRSRGLEFFKGELINLIKKYLEPKGIFEKNNFETRKLENLPMIAGNVWGEVPEWVVIEEYNWSFKINLYRGQKTGFFLDQRENRKLLYDIVEKGMKVANTFAYTGGFAIAAEKKGARAVNIEISSDSLKVAEENYLLNLLLPDRKKFIKADVFDWLREERKRGEKYDIVILDPPAFAKTLASVKKASKGYKDINFNAVKLIKNGGLLFTFSCSNHVNLDLFQKIIFAAFKDAEKEGYILRRLGQPPDHPISIYHPEGEYLKGFLIQVF